MFILPQVCLQNQVSAEEWQMRVDLAACYRLAHYYGWDDTIYTHISAKVPNESAYLVNAYGLMFDEITASNLVKVTLDGDILSETPYDINPAGFTIHSAVHQARADAHCIIHLHTIATTAVASLQTGLLPLCQHAMFPLQSIAYHHYEGLAVNAEERVRLQADLGQAHTLMLPNHGALTIGKTVGEALMRWSDLQRACETQLALMATQAPLIAIDEHVLQTVAIQQNKVHSGSSGGEMSWPAMLRKAYRLDPTFAQ